MEEKMFNDGFITPNNETLSARGLWHEEFAKEWIEEHCNRNTDLYLARKWACFKHNALGLPIDFLIRVLGFIEVKNTHNRFHPGDVIYCPEIVTEDDELRWALLQRYDSEGYVLIELPYIDLTNQKYKLMLFD